MTVPLENRYWKDFIAGEAYAFKALYDRYASQLFSFGCRYSSDEGTVKDHIHDLFVDLHTYRRRLDPDVNVRAYLYSSLRRRVLASVLEQRKYDKITQQNIEAFFMGGWSLENNAFSGEEDSALMRQVMVEIKNLSKRQQEALYLRFTAELNYKEIAGILEISVASCRTLVYRSIKDLRKKMEDTPVLHLLFLLLGRS